jgi:hypothetical protein
LTIFIGDFIKKEARSLGDDELGKVQEVRGNDIITKVGLINKETYCIPKSLVEKYDGHNLWFKMSKDDAKSQYKIAD